MRMPLILWALVTTGQSSVWMGISGRVAGNFVFGRELQSTSLFFTGAIDSSNYSSKEAFVNEIYPSVVDSSFTSYFLCNAAGSCSFVKFDYDDWVKYGLQESVTIDILNELAKKCYENRSPALWDKERLAKAICISRDKADSLLDPALFGTSPPDSTINPRRRKRILHRKMEKWSRLPAQERTVFYFSRPEFTDDGKYAVIDLEYRCDVRLCGMGATCLFRLTDSGWKLIGRKIRWGG